MKKIEEYVRSIPDFPEPGIIFRDITSVLQDADGLQLAIDSMQECLKDVDVDVVAGTESRGFIFGVPMEGIYFGEAEEFAGFLKEHDTIAVTYYPEINRFRGRESLQIIIQNYC